MKIVSSSAGCTRMYCYRVAFVLILKASRPRRESGTRKRKRKRRMPERKPRLPRSGKHGGEKLKIGERIWMMMVMMPRPILYKASTVLSFEAGLVG